MNFLTLNEVKNLSLEEAEEYCEALRSYLIETVNVSGGHLASNLGVAEISLACIRVFNLPEDKIIYDVGHQSYVHKLLTGRVFDKDTLRAFGGYSGFTKRDESEYDPFGAGHSSTALSASLGFARANRLKNDPSYTVAVVGDGAFCTGMTFEALNNIDMSDRLIIILNDNEMSISRNVGTMSEYLVKIRSTNKYIKFKRRTKNAFGKMKCVGKVLFATARKTKYFVKRIVVKNTFFEELGISYLGPADGNDLATVELLLEEAKSRTTPTLVHFCTKKGKGYLAAEQDPDRFHGVSPKTKDNVKKETFSDVFGNYITEKAQNDKRVVSISAAMCEGTGLSNFRKDFPDRFFDVGICEEHALTFAAAMSASGFLPYFAVYSTFFQRCFDQLLHDCSLQNLKVTLALDRAGFCERDGATHHGVFDVPLLLTVPRVAVFSPATFDELKFSFDSGEKLSESVAVRYPKGTQEEELLSVFSSGDFSFDEEKNCDVLIITYGRITAEVLKAKRMLEEKNIKVSVLKFLKLKPLDTERINALISKISPSLIVCVEEGVKSGGFGQYVFSNLQLDAKSKIIAINDTFVPHGTLQELYEFAGIDAKTVCDRISRWMKE